MATEPNAGPTIFPPPGAGDRVNPGDVDAVPTALGAHLFDDLERRAIRMGAEDPVPLGDGGGLRARVRRFFMPPRQLNGLANARLEFLRRYVIALRHGSGDVEHLRNAAAAAGFDGDQLDAIILVYGPAGLRHDVLGRHRATGQSAPPPGGRPP